MNYIIIKFQYCLKSPKLPFTMLEKDTKIEGNIIKDVRNLFRLIKEIHDN